MVGGVASTLKNGRRIGAHRIVDEIMDMGGWYPHMYGEIDERRLEAVGAAEAVVGFGCKLRLEENLQVLGVLYTIQGEVERGEVVGGQQLAIERMTTRVALRRVVGEALEDLMDTNTMDSRREGRLYSG